MRRTGLATRTTALLVALLAGSVTAGCTNGEAPARPPDGSRSEDGRAPRTGSPLIVKIDNVSRARPQTGLDAADIVYAEQVEGGLSRLMAVYATKLPEAVGPVRSARESDLELIRQFEKPTLAFSGAQGRLLPLIDRAPLHPALPEDNKKAYYRSTDRPIPHNLYLRPRVLLGSAPGAEALTTGFTFGEPPTGGTAEKSRTVRYPAARFTFTWSESRERWLVSMDGTPTVTTGGKRVAAGTVVVQYVTVRESRFSDSLGNNTPYTQTVGSGTAKVLRDGKAFDVEWKRGSAADGTRFTAQDGTPVNFAHGQVWVVFAKA